MKPVASHLVVPRINFLRSAKGYNAKLIQSTLNLCICQSCSILPHIFCNCFHVFPMAEKQTQEVFHIKKCWCPRLDDICPFFGRGKFAFQTTCPRNIFAWYGEFPQKAAIPFQSISPMFCSNSFLRETVLSNYSTPPGCMGFQALQIGCTRSILHLSKTIPD